MINNINKNSSIYIVLLFILLMIVLLLLFDRINNTIEYFDANNIDNINIQIDICYPEVSIDFLKKYETSDEYNDEIDDYFTVDKIINKLPNITNAISVSLFCKNINNHYENELESPDNDIDSVWYKKYMQSLINNINSFGESELVKNNWKFRIYLANDLATKKYIYLLSRPFVEIYIMKSSSIGAQPGMLWRFLSYSDKTLEVVLVIDIDDTIENIFYKIPIFNEYPNHIMLKSYNIPVKVSEDTDIINNAVIIGSMQIIRPKLFNLDISSLMAAFIRYRMDISRTNNPNFYGEKDTTTICNKPLGKHIYGWGNHWFMYGFDERFLKHVIFYYIVRKGGMVSTYDKELFKKYPEEYNYVMSVNSKNVFIE